MKLINSSAKNFSVSLLVVIFLSFLFGCKTCSCYQKDHFPGFCSIADGDECELSAVETGITCVCIYR